jgi:hypothetical protein
MAEIQSVIDEIVILQNAVPTPSGERDIQMAYDEPPETFGIFPCFVNLEQRGFQSFPTGNWGYLDYIVNMHLIFSAAAPKYAMRSRRLWVLPVIKHFRQNVSLNNTCALSKIEEWSYSPEDTSFAWNGTEYVAINFVLRIKAQEDW